MGKGAEISVGGAQQKGPKKTTDSAARVEVQVKSPTARNIHENGELKVLAVDAPDIELDGMCHRYVIESQKGPVLQEITFQHGAIEKVGVNGVTHYEILAIIEDRLRCFQRGAFSSYLNEVTLAAVVTAKVLGAEKSVAGEQTLIHSKVASAAKLDDVDESKTPDSAINTKGLRLVDESENLRIFAFDLPDPNAGGACHEYVIVDRSDRKVALISFQHGPVKERGINGIQHIELLAIIEDRIRSAQISKFAKTQNEFVFMNVVNAIQMDQERTKRRALAGLEGFNKRVKGVEK